jgi:hypothetical protein
MIGDIGNTGVTKPEAYRIAPRLPGDGAKTTPGRVLGSCAERFSDPAKVRGFAGFRGIRMN